jgi:hypothetical protein
MTLRAIHGKPGSGKSCYCVSLLLKQLADWVRYDREHDEPYERVLYTNIPLHIDAINDYRASITNCRTVAAYFFDRSRLHCVVIFVFFTL